jgi:pSer/pThr/pTyr-binding forkhead associated (FHA) protein
MSNALEIMIMSGPYDGQVVRLSAPNNRNLKFGTGYILGRHDSCDLCIYYDQRVSRYHARLYHERGQWHLEDLQSTHKTYLAQTRADGSYMGRVAVESVVPVSVHTMIQLGPLWLRLQKA